MAEVFKILVVTRLKNPIFKKKCEKIKKFFSRQKKLESLHAGAALFNAHSRFLFYISMFLYSLPDLEKETLLEQCKQA